MIADDESSIRLLVRRIAEENNYGFCSASDGVETLQVFAEQHPDLLFLDVMMPRLDGFEVCERLREQGTLIPIIFLSAKGDLVDKGVGLKAGGDEYLVKPVSPQELLMRIEAHLRQHRRAISRQTDTLEVGDFLLDMKRHRASIGGRPIELTHKEFQILALLASHPGEIFTKEQLISEVWGEEYSGNTTSIAVFIRKIREKIETDPSKPQRLQTVWHVGYRFCSQNGC
jgi:two-component system response regulator VicR